MTNNRLIKSSEVIDIPRTPGEALDRLNQILWESQQKTLTDAILADIVDALVGLLPFLGDTLEITRVSDAIQKSDKYRRYRIALYVIDTLIGYVPLIGDVADILLPANTINFLAERVSPEIERRISERYGVSLSAL